MNIDHTRSERSSSAALFVSITFMHLFSCPWHAMLWHFLISTHVDEHYYIILVEIHRHPLGEGNAVCGNEKASIWVGRIKSYSFQVSKCIMSFTLTTTPFCASMLTLCNISHEHVLNATAPSTKLQSCTQRTSKRRHQANTSAWRKMNDEARYSEYITHLSSYTHNCNIYDVFTTIRHNIQSDHITCWPCLCQSLKLHKFKIIIIILFN